jgi:hypothetical protein
MYSSSGTGVFGAVASVVFVSVTGRLIETAKIMVGLAGLVGVAITMLLRIPDQEAAIATLCAMYVCEAMAPM